MGQIPPIQNSKSPPKTNLIKQKSRRSSIRQPTLKIDISGKPRKKKHLTPTKDTFDVLEKIDDTPPKFPNKNQNTKYKTQIKRNIEKSNGTVVV